MRFENAIKGIDKIIVRFVYGFFITPAIKYPKAVIPAKAGIQENTLDAGSSLPRTGYGVRHDKVRVLFRRVN